MSRDERSFDIPLLRTGFVPDELESKPIKTAIATQREAIEAIDSQISDLEQRIADLRKNRQDLSGKMALNEAFFAPMRRVAPETLCEIFEYCIPPEPTQNTTFPLTLMSVCHAWRRIVQEIPELWAQIYVNSRTRLSLVEMILRNSMLVPLDVTLALCDETYDITSDSGSGAENLDQTNTVTEKTDIVRVISKQHRRIRRLSLHAPYSILEVFFPSRFRMKTSLLEDLTIDCPNSPTVDSRFLLKGGRLCTLNINGKMLFTTSINRTFGLRRISLQGPVPVFKLLEFLRVSPALEELTMEKFTPFRSNEPPVTDLDFEPILLTKLTRLEIYFETRILIRSVRESPLGYIRAPAVTSLFFKLNCYLDHLDDLYNLLISSAKSVLRLSLEGLECPSYQFFRVIRGLSALEVLHLADLQVEGLWDMLTPEEHIIPSAWLCPKLTTLELRQMSIKEPFLEFVRRRTKPIQSETIQDGFHYLGSVVISQQYVPPEVSTILGNLEIEREGFFLEIRDDESE